VPRLRFPFDTRQDSKLRPLFRSPFQRKSKIANFVRPEDDLSDSRFCRWIQFLSNGGDCPASYLLPILFQHQLIYPVGVKHLMHQQVPEHYIHRVVAERLVLGGPLPIL
jgi:hypothetical protein